MTIYIPQGFTGEPVDHIDVLKRGRAVLAEEAGYDRWMQSDWFTNPHFDPEKPFCNSWTVCAEGANAIVSIGVKIPEGTEFWGINEWGGNHTQQDNYDNANEWLFLAGEVIWGDVDGESANYFNDRYCRTRTEAIQWFDKAIEMAEAKAAVS